MFAKNYAYIRVGELVYEINPRILSKIMKSILWCSLNKIADYCLLMYSLKLYSIAL